MSPRRRRSAAVVISAGPATEAGPQGLRAALALAVAGLDVSVVLVAEGGLLARALATPWVGGDPGADLDALIDELDAHVVVDAASAADGDGVHPQLRRSEVRRMAAAEIGRLLAGADLVGHFG